VGSHTADFIHRDPLSNIYVSSTQDCHNHPELKRKVYSALAESDEGELSIVLPKEVHLKQSGHSEVGIVSESGLNSPAIITFLSLILVS
jgi:transcription initiation factor TFIID subunit 2